MISRNKSTPRRSFLQAKTHKKYTSGSDIEMRHIFSSSNSPSSGLEVKINKILNKINNKSNFILKSPDEFRNKVKDLKEPRGFEIITADIKKMFESISIDKTLEYTDKILKLKDNKKLFGGNRA